MEKIYRYNNVSPTDMKYYIPKIKSSILNGTDLPVTNNPDLNRFIRNFAGGYLYLIIHSMNPALPRISRIKSSAKIN